ncbi:MAG: glycoside hydrolase [Clostridia bacterium]|nr:glycoside hydrolase [Clostridia bacterium]
MQQIITEQIGYLPNDKKTAIVHLGDTPKAFCVKNYYSKEVVFQGSLSKPVENASAGETDYVMDFSEITENGTYYISIDGVRDSYPFVINPCVYDDVMHGLLRFFYLQRCGTDLPEALADKFKHKSCHDTEAFIYGTDLKKNVNGGWHDAGDYGRYIVAAAVTVADLLLAYENNPKCFGTKINIPRCETAIPDLLTEVRYELEWMLRMQDETTGEVYHKVTCEGFPDVDIMPEDETEKLVICPPSVTATADFAAVMAMAVRYYQEYDHAFADTCMKAAVTAYDAMKKMNLPGGFKNPESIVTGEYEDDCDIDERYWAAAELYKATGEARYHEDLKELLLQGTLHGYGWREVGSLGNTAYLSINAELTDEAVVQKISENVIDLGRELLEMAKENPYAYPLKQYEWGSNMYVANSACHLYDAYRLTQEEDFLIYAKEQIHHLFGKNPNAICYVTGYGSVSPKKPHHRPSAAVGEAMPGMLVGGPDEGLHDPSAEKYVGSYPPAKRYVDHVESYSTNEVTIYWNSALLLAMSLCV